jgi:uncharacterized protein
VSFTRLRRPLLILALAGAVAVSVAAAQTKIPPAPDRWATDEAGFLSRQTVEALDARLEGYEQQTGHQFLVWIGRTLGENEVLEDWAVKAFEAWKVGRRGLDDGLVLFIFAEDRKIRIEVGYGLEDKVPDAYAYRVINNILVPGFGSGRPDQAVDDAVTALIGYISGKDAVPEDDRGTHRGKSPVNNIFAGLAVLIFFIILITNPSLAFWLLLNILGGGRGRGGRGGGGFFGGGGGGGWGGGGGGFSGGGGMSGGGGASGSW